MRVDLDPYSAHYTGPKPLGDNTSICKKLHGKLLEGFIINARTDIYHIMCSIDAHEKEHQSSSCDYGSSGGGCSLRVAVRTKTGGDTPHMLVQGGKHGRGATKYTGTK